MSGLSVYFLLLAGILLDGHSTYIGLANGYKESNPLLLGLKPKAVGKTTFIMWAALSALFIAHEMAKSLDPVWYADRDYYLIFLALALAKILAALENYALFFFGSNIRSILRLKMVKVFPVSLTDIGLTLLIVGLPAILIAHAILENS